ncbi:unnamed protein product [Acanthoscelides obtectus]|uniref:Insulin-like growth factor-binding protein complex acid labile subunit n=1 Tax=Acanthoscelides obtectus TaxID=200917 RepID=A0A9P0P6S7_ACAOB|nr:unnamed protein product [Acanthoscelides obtectus]CAK1640055.1 Insulin-like growth factor-binding protein complex acid labile subunit [Acanthoscelides obtectus]
MDIKINLKISWIVGTFLTCTIPLTLGMSCSYGERGSLTVYCTNATTRFFKITPYRFDHLDETFKCINCTLTTLEQGTFDMSGNQIKVMDISNSSVTYILPKAFIGLIFMEKLILNNNQIRDISLGAFIGIRKIRVLEMENTVGELHPFVFQELHLLEEMNMKHSKLTTLEDGVFEGLHNLRILDISYNKLSSISNQTFTPLVHLESLNLEYNEIKKIHTIEFHTLNHLLALNVRHNHIQNASVKFSPQSSLRSLNLAENELHLNTDRSDHIGDLPNLEELDLSANTIEKTPIGFLRGLFRLRVLNLSFNKIEHFTVGAYTGLPHLRVLNLSNNALTQMKVIGRLQLHSLDRLDLANNNLKEFNYIGLIIRAPKLSYLNLYNNDIECHILYQLEVAFSEDNVNFVVGGKNANGCSGNITNEDLDEVIRKLAEEYYITTSSTASILFFSCLLLLLVGVLFYIQFFVLDTDPRVVFRRSHGQTTQQDIS